MEKIGNYTIAYTPESLKRHLPEMFEFFSKMKKTKNFEKYLEFDAFYEHIKKEDSPIYSYNRLGARPWFNMFICLCFAENDHEYMLIKYGIMDNGNYASQSEPEITPQPDVEPSRNTDITTIDPERLNLAQEIDTRINNRAKSFLLQTLADLKQIHDSGLFEELGHNSLNSYLIGRLNMEPGAASKYVRIVEHLLPFIKLYMYNFSDKLLSDNNLNSGTNVEIIRNLPTDVHKLYALSKLKPDWKTDLFEKGKVRLRGKWITLEDFCRLSRQQVMDIVDACMNSRKTDEEKAAIVLPWTKYREVVFTKIDRFQSTLFDIQRSPSMPPEVLTDFNNMLDGVNEFWDKYFPNGRDPIQAQED